MSRYPLALVTSLCLASINCSSAPVAPPSQLPQAPTPGQQESRPVNPWANPDPDESRRDARAKDFAAKVSTFLVPIHQEISNPPPAALRAVDNARREIMRWTFTDKMWRPEDLRVLVDNAGTNPVLLGEVAQERASRPAFSHSIFFNGIHVSSTLAREHVHTVSVALIHELTHALVRNVFIAETGLSPSEFVGLLTHCQDIGRAYFFTTEALAAINHITYAIDLANVTGNMGLTTRSPFDEAAKAYVQGAPNSRHAFTKAVAKRAQALWEKERARYGVTDVVPVCGLPVVIRLGRTHGAFFLPQDLAPKIISPLLTQAVWDE